jgi:hypothetical protein
MVWAAFIAVRTRSITLFRSAPAMSNPVLFESTYVYAHLICLFIRFSTLLILARKIRHTTRIVFHSPFMGAPYSFIASLEGYLCSYMVTSCTSNTKNGELLLEVRFHRLEIVVPL